MDNLTKPCRVLQYCPYGAIAAQFDMGEYQENMMCAVFGNPCPVFWFANGHVAAEMIPETFEKALSETDNES